MDNEKRLIQADEYNNLSPDEKENYYERWQYQPNGKKQWVSINLNIYKVHRNNFESFAKDMKHKGATAKIVYKQRYATTPALLSEQKQEGETVEDRASNYAYDQLRTEDKQDWSDNELHEGYTDEYFMMVDAYIAGQSQHAAKQIEEKDNRISELEGKIHSVKNLYEVSLLDNSPDRYIEAMGVACYVLGTLELPDK